MKYLIIILLLLPVVSGVNITLDYNSQVSINEEIEFNVCVINSTNTYDFKLDIFQNEKRISRIFNNDKWYSTIYYLKNVLNKCKTFYIKINDGVSGNGEITVKLRNSKGKVTIFSPYFINIVKSKSPKKIKQRNKIKNESLIEEKITNFTIIKQDVKKLETIKLSPKVIKSDSDSKILYEEWGKYSFVLFSLIVSILYIIKPKKKENEFK